MAISNNYDLDSAGIDELIIWAVDEQNTDGIGACFYSSSGKFSATST